MLEAKKGHLFSPKDMAILIFPLVIEQLLSITIGMADTIMVSSYSESAVSAVSSVDVISYLFIQLFAAFSTGGAVIVSQYLGKGDREKAKTAAKNLIYISTTLSIIILIIGLSLKDLVIEWVLGKAEASVQRDASLYYVPIMFSFPFLAIFDATTAISRSIRKTTRTMLVAVLINIVNICGNYTLIYIFDMGAEGAALASMTSRAVGALVMFIIMRREKEECSLSHILKGPLSFDMQKRIMKIGIPSAIDGSLFSFGKLIVQSFIAGLGTSALAIHAVVGNFNSYSNIPGNAIALATISLVGYAAGAKNNNEERYYARLMLIIAIVATFAVTLPMYICAKEVISIYSLSSTNTLLAVPICRLCLVMCTFIWPFAFVLPNALRATGDVRFTMVSSVLSMWAFRVALCYILIFYFNMGVEGVWYAMYADWAFRGLLYFTRYKGSRWQQINVV